MYSLRPTYFSKKISKIAKALLESATVGVNAVGAQGKAKLYYLASQIAN